ncbi:TIR domain-containing protein [Adhaeribacter rhizoryzae]|uniref:TIR domain-containing protein n=2 Tax=Adhaeribacter rhizoryzae TaxID=2607907 RepID=A0A5M6DN89_9BACT|nr:TIR domain-containing protein [Adhaeribacter rhizoryzae]
MQVRVAADPSTNRPAGLILHSNAPYTSKINPDIDLSNFYEFEVALSFAGEDRDFVKCVAAKLKDNGVKIFYDEYEQVNLWGKNLYEHLDQVYRVKSKFCVIFISRNYKDKLWTNHERQSAQARAFQENEEYILPFRLDNTEIPGLRPTIGYLSKENTSCEQLAIAIYKKIRSIG